VVVLLLGVVDAVVEDVVVVEATVVVVVDIDVAVAPSGQVTPRSVASEIGSEAETQLAPALVVEMAWPCPTATHVDGLAHETEYRSGTPVGIRWSTHVLPPLVLRATAPDPLGVPPTASHHLDSTHETPLYPPW
jgi:hypothetical protein